MVGMHRSQAIAIASRVSLSLILVASFATSSPAQFRPVANPSVGERYHIEAAFAYWNPDPELVIASESLGIPGTEVDLINDLGIEKKRIPEVRLVLRPATKHKFRFNYIPLKYDVESVVVREFVFNGQRYRVGLPVNTTADLTTYRFGYEYDFFYRDAGYAGVLVDLKYTNVDVELDSPIGDEFTRAVAPIPTFGFTGRGYTSRNTSITGEVSFFKVPERLGREDFGGRYVDFDIYGTVNFNDYVGAQIGYRSIGVNYFQDGPRRCGETPPITGIGDCGDLSFKGFYFSGVVRF
jgi:hypothetical protein